MQGAVRICDNNCHIIHGTIICISCLSVIYLADMIYVCSRLCILDRTECKAASDILYLCCRRHRRVVIACDPESKHIVFNVLSCQLFCAAYGHARLCRIVTVVKCDRICDVSVFRNGYICRKLAVSAVGYFYNDRVQASILGNAAFG